MTQTGGRWTGREWLIAAVLAAATVCAFSPVLSAGFITYDDPGYILDNLTVRGGLTWYGVRYAFTTGAMANYHPLTWLSYMADVQLFGLNPRGFHATSLMFHAANAVLLFGLLRSLTGATWRSAAAAALFALHPLRVESVAWVSERKDVLSLFFGLLCLWSYAGYVREKGPRRWGLYGLSWLLLGLGLLAKPMLVTWPAVMLLLDFCPLGRWRGLSAVGRVIVEKIPFFALTVASCWMTFRVQKVAMAPDTIMPLPDRIGHACIVYWEYVFLWFYPVKLAVFYPHTWKMNGAVAVVAAAGLVVALGLAFWQARRRGWVLTGLAWYLGTLVPVIGLVQVGSQSMADRYTYVPMIGLAVLAAWGVGELVERARLSAAAPACLAAVVLVALAGVTIWQCRFWHDARMLMERALAVTSRNHVAHWHLGDICRDQGDAPESEWHYDQAMAIDPNGNLTLVHLGIRAFQRKDYGEAERYYSQVLARDINLHEVNYNLGRTLQQDPKRADEAEVYLRRAVAVSPDNAVYRDELGRFLAERHRVDEAAEQYRSALAVAPDYPEANFHLGLLYEYWGKYEEAMRHYQVAGRDPTMAAYPSLKNALARMRKRLGQSP